MTGRDLPIFFVLAGDGSWDEGTRLIPINGIASADRFGWSVALSGDRALIGARYSDEIGMDSGAAYIFHRMNGVWQEEAKLVPTDGASGDAFGYDVALSGDTAFIGSPRDDDMGCNSGSVYVFVRRDDGTWEEVQKLTPADGEPNDNFGRSVAISGDTAVIGAIGDNVNGDASGSSYVYTKIDGKWIENVKIVPENGASYDFFGTSVAISGSTALFGAPSNSGVEENTALHTLLMIFAFPDKNMFIWMYIF